MRESFYALLSIIKEAILKDKNNHGFSHIE